MDEMQKNKVVKKIVAIGGGEIGGPGCRVETTGIDKEIIRLSGKKKPRLLFVPTASSDAPGYVENVRKHFGEELGCKVDALLLLDGKCSKKEITRKIKQADIVYVGGGDTLLMMKVWKKHGVDELLLKAYKKGTVMAGLSAGSICWFRSSLSDSKRFKGGGEGFAKVAGLGIIKALHCPHYDVEKARPAALRQMMEKTAGVAVALENCVAMVVVDDRFRIITSKAGAKAYKIYFKKRAYHKREIGQASEYTLLSDFLKK